MAIDYEKWAAESRAKQGLPPKITDPVVLAAIVRLLRMPRHDHKEEK